MKYGKYSFNVSREITKEESEKFDFPQFIVRDDKKKEGDVVGEIKKDHDLSVKEQIENLDNQKERLNEKRASLLSGLKEKMEKAVNDEDFQEAAKIRDEIKSIKG